MKLTGFNEPDLPANLHDFDDADSIRSRIYDGALQAVQSKFPVSDGKHRLELANVRYDDPDIVSLADQKRALMTDRSVRRKMKGTWRLYDEATNQLLEERDDVLMGVPVYTGRGTVINNGSDYAIVSQARLKPGAYARTRKSGEHEVQFNVKPGTGTGFRMWLEPDTGLLRVNVGQANIPAYTLMKAVGYTDGDLEKAWGAELLARNAAKDDPRNLGKLYEKFAGRNVVPDADQPTMTEGLLKALSEAQMDPGVVARTMGMEDVSNVTPSLLMRASQKLYNINRGDEQPDDRDAPEFSEIMSVDDLLKERIDKDAGGVVRNMMYKMRRSGNLKPAMRNVFNSYVESLLYSSGLAQPLEEVNPLHILEQTRRQVRTGEGGLPSARAITEEARDVHGGQVGFTDPVAGPEDVTVGTDTRYAYRTFKGDDRQVYGEFVNPRTGKLEYLKPEDTANKIVAFPGQDVASLDEVYAIQRGKMVKVPAEDVDYQVPSQAHMFAHGINLAPMATGFQPGRAFFISKYWSQILPLVEGEAPLVRNEVPGTGRSFNEYYGRKTAAINSPVDGTVTDVRADTMTVTDPEGKKHVVELAKDFPFNRISSISYKATAKVGDKVAAGDMIANSNFTTPTGELALGRNLKVGVLPYKGHAFEDAMVISESAAKKLATERLFGFDVSQRMGTEVSKNKYISAFPSQYSMDQLNMLDDDGVVREGTLVRKGDPLILATAPKVLSARDAAVGNLHKVLRNSFKDESVVWESDEPGVVTDVAFTARGAKVNVKSVSPVKVGDKLTNAESSKGVVGKIVEDDKMPRDSRTDEPFDVMFNQMTILSRVAPNQILEMYLSKVAKKTGKPYMLPVEAPDAGWDDFVEKELAHNKVEKTTDVYDPETGRTIKNVGDGYMYFMPFHHIAEKKLCLTDDTEVLTDTGWVKLSDFKPGMKVQTYNRGRGEKNWQFPTAINRYDVRGQTLYRVEGDGQDCVVTRDHTVCVDQESPGNVISAEDLHRLCERGLY